MTLLSYKDSLGRSDTPTKGEGQRSMYHKIPIIHVPGAYMQSVHNEYACAFTCKLSNRLELFLPFQVSLLPQPVKIRQLLNKLYS